MCIVIHNYNTVKMEYFQIAMLSFNNMNFTKIDKAIFNSTYLILNLYITIRKPRTSVFS